MSSWILALLCIFIGVEVKRHFVSRKDGLLRKHFGSAIQRSRKISRAVNAFLPLLFVLSLVGWVYTFPAAEVAEDAELGAFRRRIITASEIVQGKIASFDEVAEPVIVWLDPKVGWFFDHLVWILAALLAIDLVSRFVFKLDGPLRRLYAWLTDSDARPGTASTWSLAAIPFAGVAFWYFLECYTRHAEEPMDKIMPIPSKIWGGIHRVAIEGNQLWVDTLATSKLFGSAVLIISLGILVGIAMERFPRVTRMLKWFTAMGADKVQAFAILVVVFIIFGTDNNARIALAVIGVGPTIALTAYLEARAVRRELVDKARTQAATDMEVGYRVMLPEIFPKLLDALRLNFKMIVGILIVAETIGGTEGLGYQIFVSRRRVLMDVIIPYVVWITILTYTVDLAMRMWIRFGFPAYQKG